MLKQANISHFNQLQELYRVHAEEANVSGKLSFDIETAIELTKQRLIEEQSNILLYIRDDKVIGYSVVSLSELTWNRVRIANIEMFFIHPDYRQKISSHKFFDQIEEFLRDKDVELLMSGVFLFDNDYNVDEEYVERASKYFEMKNMKWCGNMYIKEL